MRDMCWGCSPYCGKCKPAPIIPVVCPTCGKALMVTREEYLRVFGLPHRGSDAARRAALAAGPGSTGREKGALDDDGVPRCKRCGRDLTAELGSEVDPAPCRRSGIICGYPCGRRDEDPVRGAKRCETMVPVGRYHLDS